MADIAFLLLIFFLLVTTIDVDTGIYMELPPKTEEDPPEIRQRNLLNILVSEDTAGGLAVLVDDNFLDRAQGNLLLQVRNYVKRHVTNEGVDPSLSESPDQAIVSFKTNRDTRYELYVNVLDQIKMAYNEIRNEYAQELGFPDYAHYQVRLDQRARDEGFSSFRAYRSSFEEGVQPDFIDEVATRYPMKISLAEPDPG